MKHGKQSAPTAEAPAAEDQALSPAVTAANGGDRSWIRIPITDGRTGSRGRRRRDNQPTSQSKAERKGLHWVGELMVEADVDVESSGGELLLDLVEGGKHFTCTIDLKNGEAKLTIESLADYAPTAKTASCGPGKHHVAFANVDDQLLLWVDGKLSRSTGARPTTSRKCSAIAVTILPHTSAADLGDLAPPASVRTMQSWPSHGFKCGAICITSRIVGISLDRASR